MSLFQFVCRFFHMSERFVIFAHVTDINAFYRHVVFNACFTKDVFYMKAVLRKLLVMKYLPLWFNG